MDTATRNIKALCHYLKSELDGIYHEGELESITRIVLKHLMKVDDVSLHAEPDRLIPDDKFAEFEEIVNQLKRNKPIQYIIGETDFYNCRFKVSPEALIPRQETEELVDWVIRDHQDGRQLHVLDIGTGCGCIGIVLARELAHARVDMTDISDTALLLAMKNAKKNDVDAGFYLFDILEHDNLPLPVKYDIIVSNPPYVRHSEKEYMHKNVLEYEPGLALFVQDDDPLIFYQAIAGFGQKHLAKKGEIYLEINEDLHGQTLEVFEQAGYKNVMARKDINGKYRMLYARNQ